MVNENLRCALAAFSRIGPAGRVELRDGFQLVYSGVPFGLFNTVNLTRTPQPGELDQFLHQAEEWYAPLNTAWSVWFCDDLMNPVQRRFSRVVLATAGLRQTNDAPGMLASELLPPGHQLPAIECRRVADHHTRLDFALVMSAAFQVPNEMAQAVYCSGLLWAGELEGWVAYAEKTAVSTAAIVSGGGSIGVYAVGTHPRFQRKGYGEAVVRHAVDATSRRTGVRRTVLQSSTVGYKLYSRMGYRQAGRFLVYVRE